MKIGNKLFIVKTLSGETISIRNSERFVVSDIARAEKLGHSCIVVECTIDAIHTKKA